MNRDLIDLPIEIAVGRKFARGRKRHGEKWVGRRPILEAHDEILDALAYLNEEYWGRTGDFPGDPLPEPVMGELMTVLANGLRGVRVLIESCGVLEEEGNGAQNGAEDGRGPGPNRPDEAGRGREGI